MNIPNTSPDKVSLTTTLVTRRATRPGEGPAVSEPSGNKLVLNTAKTASAFSTIPELEHSSIHGSAAAYAF